MILAGTTLRREDSDDELGDDDFPWEWVYSGDGHTSDEEDGENPRDSNAKGRRGRPARKVSKFQEGQIIGARMGAFACKIGDCVLLKADSNEAWAGIICNFMEEEEEMGISVMCKERSVVFRGTVLMDIRVQFREGNL
jgi:origin recognition complex subunit 1